MSWHCGCDVIHVKQEESRRYFTTLGNTLSQLDLSADHSICLHSCCSVEEEVTELFVILPCTPARKSFSSSPSFQTLPKACDRSKKTARTFFFSWKASSMSCVKRASWSSQSQLVFIRAEQTDWVVAETILLIFSFFWNWSFDSCLLDCWYSSC